MRKWTTHILHRFGRHRRGNVAIASALALPCLLGGMGVAADYSSMYKYQSNLQQAVDTAALAVAKEMALSSSDATTLKAVAKNYVVSNSQDHSAGLTVETTVDQKGFTIEVTASKYWEPMFLQYINKHALPIVVSAKAALKGTGKICMVGLNTSSQKTLKLESNARLVGSGCGIYSNSTDAGSMSVGTSSEIDASFICSAGGIKGYEEATFTPTPVVDCPPVGDPLAGRSVPKYGACNHTDLVISGGTHTLEPGVYCNGLEITGGANVTLKSGRYVIKDDKLIVGGHASMTGNGVGIHLAGDNATIDFKKQSTIDLSAMDHGDMAGILFWGTSSKGKIKNHKLSSDNARNLLGTIYLPSGYLYIDSEGTVADQSAYTAVIANRIELRYGPTLVLNSNYDATSVPVPESLKGEEPYLVN